MDGWIIAHCTLAGDIPVLVHEPGQSVARRGDVLYIAPREDHWHLFDVHGLAIERRGNDR